MDFFDSTKQAQNVEFQVHHYLIIVEQHLLGDSYIFRFVLNFEVIIPENAFGNNLFK